MKKTTKKVEQNYAATIKVLGKTYTSTGSSVREALENLAPGKAKGISILSMTKGELKRDKVLNFGQTFRLFSASPLMREIALKQVTMLFDL